MNGLGRRIARLESDGGDDDYLPFVTIDDLVGDHPLVDWPEGVSGVRMFNGVEHQRCGGEGLAAFRRRLSVELGVRGPGRALPHIVELMIAH